MTNLYLLKDIDFTKDYGNVVDFDNVEMQHSYFLSKQLGGYSSEANYIRGERESIKVAIPQIVAQEYSYMMFTNTTPSGEERTYYCFIDQVNYVQPDVSQVFFTVDVWQTYLFDFEIKEAFIDREHQDRWTSDNKPIFNLELEDIDLGSEMEVVDINVINNEENIVWYEIVTTDSLSTSTDGDFHSFVANVGQPFYTYFVAVRKTSLFPVRIKTGTKLEEQELIPILDYFLSSTEFGNILASNPKIVSVRLKPYAPFNYTVKQYNGEDYVDTNQTIKEVKGSDTYSGKVINYTGDVERTTIGTLSILYENNLDKGIPRDIRNETKLLTYPYTNILITNNQHEPLVIKPQYLKDEMKIKYVASIGFQSKSKIYVDNYLGDNGKMFGKTNSSIGELPLVNDQYLTYMANNKASSVSGLAVSGASVVGGTGTIVAGLGKVAGFGLGLSYLGIGMAVSGAVNIINELSKRQDLKEMPNDIKEMGNNLIFDLIDDNLYYRVVKQELVRQIKQKVYDYFYRFGYKANKFGIPNLRSRYYFNFIKTIDISIAGNINNSVREELIGIFNRGTTIWHDRIDNDVVIHQHDLENVEVSLIG